MPQPTASISLSLQDILDFGRQYNEIMRAIEQAAGTRDLPAFEAIVLSHIIKFSGNQAAIARRLSMDTGLLNKRVKNLKKKCLIETVDDGTRWPPLIATEKGKAASMKEASRLNSAMHKIFSELTQAELGSFYESTARLGEHRYDPDVYNVFEYREAKPCEMAWVFESIVGADDEPDEYGFDKTFQAYVLETLANVLISAADSGNFVLIAATQGRIVGSIICESSSNDVINFPLLAERYGYNNGEIAKILIAEAVKRARSLGFKRAIARTFDGISESHPYGDSDWKQTGSSMEDIFGRTIEQRIWTLELTAKSNSVSGR